MVLVHPIRRDPVAAVRQVSGMLARTIVCAPAEGVVLQRGQRYGIIKLGSTTELYIPERFSPEVLVQVGQHVRGGTTILATISIGAANEATKFD
jgi:phosphatidylserine decarboxylase